MIFSRGEKMKQYLELCNYILEHGEHKKDRTGTGTISVFGYMSRYNLQEGFPLLTTKKVHIKSILGELLWFISGDTNIYPLVKNGIRIWNEWPYASFCKSKDYQDETMDEFIEKIKSDESFRIKFGDLGPVYGKQWRDFFGVDQLLEVEQSIKLNPHSRRHIISAWNPAQIKDMALPPCHAFVQFYVSADGKRLSCQLYQRSADVFLGVPFNIASYALLTHMIAYTTGLEVGDFVHTLGDAHIYMDHIENVKIQLSREVIKLPTLKIKRKVNSITEFVYDDFEICDYHSHPAIKGKVSV